MLHSSGFLLFSFLPALVAGGIGDLFSKKKEPEPLAAEPKYSYSKPLNRIGGFSGMSTGPTFGFAEVAGMAPKPRLENRPAQEMPPLKSPATTMETCWLRTTFKTSRGKVLTNTCAGYHYKHFIKHQDPKNGVKGDWNYGIVTTAECFFAKDDDRSQIVVHDEWLSFNGKIEMKCGTAVFSPSEDELLTLEVSEKNDIVRIHKDFLSYNGDPTQNVAALAPHNLAIVNLVKDCQTALLQDYGTEEINFRTLKLASTTYSKLSSTCKVAGYKPQNGKVVWTAIELENTDSSTTSSCGTNSRAGNCFKLPFKSDRVWGPVLCSKATKARWVLYGMGLIPGRVTDEDSEGKSSQYSAPAEIVYNADFLEKVIGTKFEKVEHCRAPTFELFGLPGPFDPIGIEKDSVKA